VLALFRQSVLAYRWYHRVREVFVQKSSSLIPKLCVCVCVFKSFRTES
jgi:hypothetical protein